METRANHLLIGGFVLIVVAGLFGFVIWLAKIEIDREFAYYDIYFDTAVSGLSVGGDVRFKGIPVGTVKEIALDPENPNRVRVNIEVASGTPIREDTVASLEFQGITGVSFVQLSGGSPDSPMLTARREDELPQIRSVPSALQELFAGAPELIDRVIILVDRLSRLADEENQRHVASILSNADAFSAQLAGRGPELDRIIVNIDEMTSGLRRTLAGVETLVDRLDAVSDSADATLSVARGTLASVDGMIENDVRHLLGDLRSTSQSVEKLSREVETLVSGNREELEVFASQGLVEFTRFIEEARLLVASTARLVEELQADPGQFLFGERGGVQAE